MKTVIMLLCLFPSYVFAQSEADKITSQKLAESVWEYWDGHVDHWVPVVRSLALANLSRFPENADKAAPLILKRLKDEKADYLRTEIVCALGQCGMYGNADTRTAVADVMLDILKSTSETEQIKELAFVSVLKSRDPRAMPLLCELLNSKDDKQVVFALAQLASFKDPFVETQVIKCLQQSYENKKTQIALAALTTLKKIGTEASIQPLLVFVRTDKTIRGEIIAVLDTIHPSIGTESLNAILEAERLEQERLAAIEAERQAREIATRAQREQEEKDRQAKITAAEKERIELIAAWDRWEAEEKKAALEGSKACLKAAKGKDAVYYKIFCRSFASLIAAGRNAVPTNASPSMKVTENDLINPLFASLEFGFKGIDENQAWYYEFKLNETETMWEISIFKITGTTGTSKAAEPWMIEACEEANLEAGRAHPVYRAPAGKPNKPRPKDV